MKKVYIEQIRERDRVESSFLVRDKIMGMAKNGKPYLTLKLMDRTGELEGRVWDRVDELTNMFDKDDFILASGKASVYLGRMQLVVQDLKKLSVTDIQLSDYLPVAHRPTAEMLSELRNKIDSLEDENLKSLMMAFLDDTSFVNAYSSAPAAKSMHHVYLGGLLEHSLAVADLAEDVCRHYPEINRDLLLVGALLHDVGKIAELRFERSFEYTDAGKLLGHIMMGVEIVDEKMSTLPDFPNDLAILVKHLLLSHHGQYEFGSPKRPKTLEAVILNFIDDLDSKINGIRTHIDKEPEHASNWTQYHRLYDRYFYKGLDSWNGLPRAVSTATARPVPTEERPGQNKKSSCFSNTLEEQLRTKRKELFDKSSHGDDE